MTDKKDELAREAAKKADDLWFSFGKEQLDIYMQHHGEQMGIRPHYCAGWKAGMRTAAMLLAAGRFGQFEATPQGDR